MREFSNSQSVKLKISNFSDFTGNSSQYISENNSSTDEFEQLIPKKRMRAHSTDSTQPRMKLE